jgi:hypothetical protein
MRAPLLLGLIVTALGSGPTSAATVTCKGVLEYGESRAHFRCVIMHDRVRSVRGTCTDGDPGCDADGACNGVCTFAECLDASCGTTSDIPVALRKNGRAPGQLVSKTRGLRLRLRCLPRRGACPAAGTTTTTSTTSTTLPGRPCTATLSGAVTATVGCTARLEDALLGPAFSLTLDDGIATALLADTSAGTHTLGHGLSYLLLALQDPARTFQATAARTGESASLTFDTVAPGPTSGTFQVHGHLDASLPDATGTGQRVQLTADF